MANTSYIKILQAIESFANQHLQVKKFASDFPAQIPNFANKDEQYPILFVSPTDTIYNLNSNTFDIKVYCFDIIKKDRSNINTILSDTNTILNDLVIWLGSGDLAGIDIYDTTTSTAIPIDNALLDYAAGWVVEIKLEVDSYTICNIPFNNIPMVIDICNNISYSSYLTCNSLTDCPTITGITSDIANLKNKPDIFVTGGTVSSGTATFVNNSGGTFSISGFNTSTGGGSITGTGTTNYLSKWNNANGLTSSDLYNAGGLLIGIGTTNPRNVSNYANLTLENISGGTIHFRSSGATDLGGIIADNNGVGFRTLNTVTPLSFLINNVEKARFSPAGNFLLNTLIDDGINTLQVNGTGKFIGAITGNGIVSIGAFISKRSLNSSDFAFTDNISGLQRWSFFRQTAETGTGNTGNDILLARYSDAGSYLGNAFTIKRSDATFGVVGRMYVNNGVDNGTDAFQVNGTMKINNAIKLNDGLISTSTRPLVTSARTAGEIAGVSSGGELLDDGFLRLSAGGGTTPTTKSFIDLTGFGSGEMNQNIVFGASGVEIMRMRGGTRNLLINTTSDNGTDKLQINGSLFTSSDSIINGVKIGRGGGNISSNLVFGSNAMSANTTGSINTVISNNGLLNNTTSFANTAIGSNVLVAFTGSSGFNTAIGANALNALQSGGQNVVLGYSIMTFMTTGTNNIAMGSQAGNLLADKITNNTISNNSLFLGFRTSPLAINGTNEIVIGYDANGNGSNTATLGSTAITKTILNGNVLAPQYSVTALNTPPASSGATGTLGEIRWTNGFVYICVATNQWQRAALSSW